MNNQSKQALTNMLRLRLPTNQFMGSQQQQPNTQVPGPGSFQNMQRPPFNIRQTLRTQHAGPVMNQGIFNPQQQQQQQPQQPGMYSGMQQGKISFIKIRPKLEISKHCLKTGIP